MTDRPEAIFELDGDRFVPSGYARGPWDPNAMHGGAPAALLARAVEQHEPADVHVARLTIELLRPVPMVPLEVRARTIRPGKKVQLVEASVLAGDTEVVRAAALRIRTADGVFPPTDDGEPLRPGPGDLWAFDNFGELSFGMAMDVSPVSGGIGRVGAAAVWFRLRVAVVAGEEPSPLMRTAAAADFANGISAAASWDTHLFINPDLTVTLHRLPEGEWVGLDARTWAGPAGVGFAEAALHDERGRIGRAVQTLLLDQR